LWFNTGNTIKYCNSSVKYTKGTFDLKGKIDVTRGVDNVDTVVVPSTGGSGRGNGNTTFFFLFHPVHGGSSLMDLTDFVGLSSVVKDTFGCGGLSGINVSHDTNVTVKSQIDLTLLCRRYDLGVDSRRAHLQT